MIDKKVKKILKIVFLVVLFSITLFIQLEINADNSNASKVYLSVLLILNIFLIFNSKKAPLIMIFFLYFFGYTYILSIPFFYNTRIAGIGLYYNKHLMIEIARQINIAMLPFTFLSMWISNRRENLYIQDSIIKIKKKLQPNIIITFLTLCLCTIFIFFVPTGNEAGGIIKIPFEYYFLFVFLFFFYSKETFFTQTIIHFLLIASSVKTLINNGRIEFIISAIILFVLFYEKRIPILGVFFLFAFGLIFVEVYGVLRNGSNLSGLLESKYFFDRANPPYIIDSQEGYVIHSSMSMVGLVEDGIITSNERFVSFFRMLVLQFLPIGSLGDFSNANVTSYIQRYTTTLGGGLIYSQWFYWLGWKGVVLISIIVCKIMQGVYSSKNILFLIFSIVSVCLFPRWLSYFTDYLIKIPFQIVIVFICFVFINKLTNKQKIRTGITND